MRVSSWYAAAFWAVRVYVPAMLAVVRFAFFRALRTKWLVSLAWLIFLAVTIGGTAFADPTPAPKPGPSSSPAPKSSPVPAPNSSSKPTPPPPSPVTVTRWHSALDGFTSLIDQATRGPGVQPPEGSGFAAGSPLSPMTPYDTFSSAPQTPGVAGVAQFELLTSYTGRKIEASLDTGIAGVTGSVTNAVYWTENLLPVLNPHLGKTVLPYSVVFPTHAGKDDGSALGVSLPTSASVGAVDGSWSLRGGYFDLNQTDRYVFVQPPLTNQTPEVSLATAESLGNGPPTLDGWPSPPPGLPLNGLDLTVHRGAASVELTDATLPALPGTSARITNGSVVLDRGEGTQFTGQFLHLVTGGTFISTTTLYGTGAFLDVGPQGRLPTSNLGGQVSTIAAVQGAFHPLRALDATLDYGHTWYNADGVLEPGTQGAGNFYHLGLAHALGGAQVGADAYRFGPRYASAILPYGAPENIWSVAWSWPGIWLKSTYQLCDNTQIGVNRQGYRLHYTRSGGPFELHASFAEFHMIDGASIGLSHQVGFVEGFFLPQFPQFITLGKEKQIATWIGWHPSLADVTLDFVDDMMHRDANATQPLDAVSYEAPQVVLTVSKPLTKKVLAAAGFGRYAMIGSWAHGPLTNVNYQQDVYFAGGQFAESQHAIVLVQVRRSAFSGLPSIVEGPSPDFHGSLLVVEQRFHY